MLRSKLEPFSLHCSRTVSRKLETVRKMDKYHHTAIRICKRKEHKAAPHRSRHAKHDHIQKGAVKTCLHDRLCLRLRRMATDG